MAKRFEIVRLVERRGERAYQEIEAADDLRTAAWIRGRIRVLTERAEDGQVVEERRQGSDERVELLPQYRT